MNLFFAIMPLLSFGKASRLSLPVPANLLVGKK